jgi:hypothetical protein
MPRITQRLDRLEKLLGRLDGGICQFCFGHPVVAIQVMHEPHPTGPGYRKNGECYLLPDRDGDITDDLRCRGCGAAARQTRLMTLVDIGPEPEGRRVCAV